MNLRWKFVVLGVLLGTKNDGEEERSAASVGGVFIPPPVVVLNETNATECPVGSKLFSIEHSTLQDTSTSDLTWRVKERCSGLVVAQCLPCSKLSPSGSRSRVPSVRFSRLQSRPLRRRP